MSRPDAGTLKGISPTSNSPRGVWSMRDIAQARTVGWWPVVPTLITDCVLWLDASDPNQLWDATSGGSAVAADGAVARWSDKSTSGLNATQSTSGARPVRKTNVRNGRDVLRFDGSNDCLQISSITLQTNVTVFVVQSSTRTGTNLKFWMEHGSSIASNDGFFFNGTNGGAWAVRRTSNFQDGPSYDNADWIGSGWSLATFVYDSNGAVFKNNAVVSRFTTSYPSRVNSNVTAALNIASRNQASLFLNGDIGEILIYNRVLTEYERASVSAYLNSRWAMW